MPAIPAQKPFVVPPSDQKIYDSWWIVHLRIDAPNNEHGFLSLTLAPYNSETKEISPNGSTYKDIGIGLWDLLSNVQPAAIAMGAIFNAIPATEIYYDTTHSAHIIPYPQPEMEPEPEVTPEPEPEPEP